MSDIEGVTKMVGYSNSYRIKVKSIKDFRIGFFLNEEGIIILSIIVARKDIYKVFLENYLFIRYDRELYQIEFNALIGEVIENAFFHINY